MFSDSSIRKRHSNQELQHERRRLLINEPVSEYKYEPSEEIMLETMGETTKSEQPGCDVSKEPKTKKRPGCVHVNTKLRPGDCKIITGKYNQADYIDYVVTFKQNIAFSSDIAVTFANDENNCTLTFEIKNLHTDRCVDITSSAKIGTLVYTPLEPTVVIK